MSMRQKKAMTRLHSRGPNRPLYEVPGPDEAVCSIYTMEEAEERRLRAVHQRKSVEDFGFRGHVVSTFFCMRGIPRVVLENTDGVMVILTLDQVELSDG